MNRLFEIGAKIDDGWSSDNRSSSKKIADYKSIDECIVKLYTEKRKGKIVTIANGVDISPPLAKEILKRVKKRLGRGGTFKSASFEFQGDCKDSLKSSLKDEGFRI